MKIQSTVIYVLVLLFTAPFAMADPRQEPPEVWQAYAQKLEAGAFVQVHLKDGKKVKGSFIPGSPDTFRLLPKTRIAVPIRDFQFSDIASIDRKKEGFWSPGMKVLTGAAIGIGAVVLTLVAIYAAGG
jgi:hypothetical protein